ncbi:acryloyl-CoA reductase [Tepidibacillus infernus]|uniref:Quinone oxidoreductase n=1 Tax=Tepidibacillus decaturensis TaxID=1413211 RepID=A0A135L3F3_9BACI|nr:MULTISPECIES: acryloyl-CoA reductase [Tepidibacillus]KXG43526.1 quinone oxidoreductase [Tepidibacillus decaturensis]GBF12119.1 putative quinone oxidoreductase YhfP [Tepidibacillus sp. HK-1]
MENQFKALVVDKTEESFSVQVKQLALTDLPEGDVLIKVHYSSVNYKDGLASIPEGKIVQTYPFIPGIDLVGVVISSKDFRFKEGDEVIVTSYELGVSHFGGFSEYARVPADWIVPLPKGLSMREAMIYGTAGFTAALAIKRLQENGVQPENGPILVTGATGGAGSIAVAMLSKLKYEVVASTGKTTEHEYLQKIGAKKIIDRNELIPEKIKALGKQNWAGAIDAVGGKTLAYVISTTKYGGSVAAFGLTGGVEIPTTVFPFILRGVNLLGIDSVYCPMDVRVEVWKKMSNEWKPEGLFEQLVNEITLVQLPDTLDKIVKGKVRGRTIVKISK